MPQHALGTSLSCLYQQNTVSIGCLRSISEIKCDSEALDVTTLDSPCRTAIQGVRDMGEVTLEGFFEAGSVGQACLRSLYMTGESVPFTVTFPDGSAAAFPAFVKSWSLGAAQVDGAVGFTAVLRLTGMVTLTCP